MKGSKGMSAKNAGRVLCICLILILISCIGASLLQTSFGGVEIIDFKIPTANGTWIAGNLFKPVGASAENPVPIVITCPGYLNNDEMQDSTAIELSRRGVAVLSYDPYFHGDSSSDEMSVIESTMSSGVGMIPLVEYVYNNLNYVDQSQIGVMGHSMGGMSVWFTLMHYGGQYRSALEAAKEPGSDGGTEITQQEQIAAQAQNKVSAGLASGNVRLSTEETFAMIHANVGINYGKYDEGCYDLTRGNGDLSGNCYESLSAVNAELPEAEQVDSVEIGTFYGNAADKSLRVVYNPNGTHQMQHFSTESTADNVAFFLTAFEMSNPIPLENQLWLAKEIFNAIGLFAMIVLLIPLSILLLELPMFKGLKGEMPAAFPALANGKRKALFWGSWILSWVISWISYMPVTTLDKVIFPNTASMGIASLFPQQPTNYIMLWAVFNGIVGILLFLIFFRGAKKEGVTPDMLGVRIGAKDFFKTLGLAAVVFALFYAIVALAGYLFHTDFRLWFIAICGFTADKLLVMLQYLPFYFIFFFANAVLMNSFYRREGQKEGFSMFLMGLGNVLGIIALNIVQYAVLFSTGNAYWGADRLYPLLTLPLIPFLFAAAYISRQLFKATGKIWLGALINTLIFVMVAVANTATLTPLH